jgi:aminopeptidase N
MAMGLAGQRPLSNFLDLSRTVAADADPQVWGRIVGSLSAIATYLNGEPQRKAKFERYALAQLKPLMARIGWQATADQAPTVATLRDELISALSLLDDADTIAEARRRFAAQATDPAALPGPIRKTVLAVVARHADGATWDQIRAMAQNEKNSVMRDYLYQLLGDAKDVTLAQRALELALTPEPGATNSAPILGAVAAEFPDMTFDFAMQRLEQVAALVDADARTIFLPRLARSSHDPAIIGKLEALAQAHVPANSRMTLNATIARVKNTIRIRTERMPAVDAWLAHNGI